MMCGANIVAKLIADILLMFWLRAVWYNKSSRSFNKLRLAAGSSMKSSWNASIWRSLSGTFVFSPLSSNWVNSGDSRKIKDYKRAKKGLHLISFSLGNNKVFLKWTEGFLFLTLHSPENNFILKWQESEYKLTNTSNLQVGLIVSVCEQRLWQLSQEDFEQCGCVIGVEVACL